MEEKKFAKGEAIAIAVLLVVLGIIVYWGNANSPSEGTTLTKAEVAEIRKNIESFVNTGVDLYKSVGTDESFAIMSDPNGPYLRDDLYIFVTDKVNDVEILNPAFPETVGLTASTSYIDVFGVNIGQIILDGATEDGAWVEYPWYNPSEDDRKSKKYSYVVLHDGYIFGAGYYTEGLE